MAINFPQDETAMLEIRGINPDMVHRYGRYLMKLIRTTEQGYQSMCDQEDRPYDPNHQHVVIISDDEDNNENRDFDDLGGEFASQEERSAYFEPQAEVEAFNAELAQVQTIRPATQARQQSRGSKGARGGSRGPYKGGYKSIRRSSGGSSKGKASNDGVKKKAFGARSNGGGFGGGAAPGKGGHNTSGFGRGGIGMMPT
ncbi:ATP-dependent DNA helicase sgs1 [Xylographa opegraphella]|nr:ATP-dependent DNA helicase sgs1 [Xylographa opegraphella]